MYKCKTDYFNDSFVASKVKKRKVFSAFNPENMMENYWIRKNGNNFYL
jgi:hypothetical protein